MTLRIKELREERGLTQAQLADMSLLSRSQLSEIENERKPANTRRLNAIALALGVQVEDLFTSDARDVYAAAVTRILAELPEEDRKALLRHAQALRAARLVE